MATRQIEVPEALHPATADLVARFATALAEKLHKAQEKYDYYDGWLDDTWMSECQNNLAHHMAKGDPRDVAAYCAFMWHHGWPTTPERDGGDPAVDKHPLRYTKLASGIERVLYRRSLERRLGGFTLETSIEIAEMIVGTERP